MMDVIVRGYGDGELIFEDRISLPATAAELDSLPESKAQEHLRRLLPYNVHMLEFEFLDETDPLQRFLRFGTDPRRMVWPAAL